MPTRKIAKRAPPRAAKRRTPRRRSDAAIRRLNADLEQRVQQRTAELEVINHELEAFNYSVSHDLRAPLRAISGFSQALREDYGEQLDAGAHALLDRVVAAAHRMSQLIDALLELSRLSRRDMTREVVDLSALAHAIAQELREHQPERQVTFAIDNGLTAEGDPRLLRLVLENLLGNAWKFTSKHPSAHIELTSVQRSAESTPARPHPRIPARTYCVRDDGAGFNPHMADKLFGAFQRLHPADEFDGTGIGLATVQRIIHRHGGRVWAEGEVERGAAFYFTLP
jgi:light-regulated signal transduction histidine kinase (bacteriophytochrome)